MAYKATKVVRFAPVEAFHQTPDGAWRPKEPIYDKRIQQFGVGEDIPKAVIDAMPPGVLRRMKESGLIVEKVPSEVVARIEKEKALKREDAEKKKAAKKELDDLMSNGDQGGDDE